MLAGVALIPSLFELQTPLAQAENVIPILGWSFVLLILVVCAFVGIIWIRKWMRADDLPTGATGFGLSEMRAMHKRGELTDEQFERARDKITSAAKAVTSQMADPAGGRRAPTAGPATTRPGPDNTGRADRGQ